MLSPSLLRHAHKHLPHLPNQQGPTIAILVTVFAASLAMTAALALLAGCGGNDARLASDGPVRVLSASPSEQTYFSAEPIRIHFDRPVIASDAIGPVVGPLPVVVEPATALDGRFVDRQTLVLAPTNTLAASTRYRVRLIGELGKKTGGYAFEFTSMPLEIEGVWGVDLNTLPATPSLPLHFNQPVAASAVEKHCKFSTSTSFETVAAKATVKPTAATARLGIPNVGPVVNIAPKTPLDLNHHYQLMCSGLAGIGGAEPMSGLYALKIKTHPKLTVASVTPDGKKEVYADTTRFQIKFSTPMELESLRKNIRLEPAVKGIEVGWLDYRSTHYTANVELKVKTKYKLIIDGEVVDRFGQKLGKDHVVTLETGNARPTISMETGIYAVEPSAGGYPVWTRNIGEMSLACAKVPTDKVVALLTSDMNYDPWYNASSHKLGWKKLGLEQRTHALRPQANENEWHLTRLSLGNQCAKPAGATGKRDGGLYLAEIKSPDVVRDPSRSWAFRSSRRVLANVTDIGVLLKAGPASGLVWVTSISTGKPLGGAEVEVFSTKGDRVFRGKSDASGILRLPGTTKLLKRKGGQAFDYSSYRSQRMITVVTKGSDMAVVDGNWANGIQTWNFGVREDRSAGAAKIRGFIQSDRGIYRPGETVRFKGLLREIRSGRSPIVPKKRDLAISITNSRGATVYDQSHRVSRFGGFDFDFPILSAAPVGDYVVTAKHGVQTFRERFSVEEFRKVTFEIDVDKFERHQRLGQKLAFNTKTNYLFGAPVGKGDVRWDVRRRPHHVSFPKFRGYGFADYAALGYYGWWSYDGNNYSDFVGSGEGRTDNKGGFGFEIADSGSKVTTPQDYIAQVTVTDDSDQSVTKRVAVTAHPTDFYLGVHAQEWVQAVDMPFAINAVAVTPDGTQIGKQAKLSLIRETRSCQWKKRGYRSYPDCKNVHTVEETRMIDVPKTGASTERIVPKKPGDYIIRVESTDGRGRKVSSSTHLWVLGKGEAFWSGDESARMTLIASKAEYQPGETAKLVPRTGLRKPTALVTLERDGIISAFVREMESPYEGIEVPLSDAMAPNVFASVAMVSGRQGKGDRNRPRFKMGVVDLRVASEAKRLAINIKTDKSTYKPGEMVSGVIKVTSGDRPVNAEVAVSVADEGVLQLVGYKTPDPMKAFYKSFGLGIDNGTNWNRISRLNAPRGANPDAGGDAGDGGGNVRSNFVNSAYWAPALVTNSRGEARFRFKAPDNLTAFRVMAIAADNGSRFGSSDARITVAKPLLGKAVLPRFLTEKDRAEVGVMVHNETKKDGVVKVTASATGAAITPRTQEVRVPAGGAVRARFYATAEATRSASFEYALSMRDHRDALRVEVPIERPIVFDDALIGRGTLGPTNKVVSLDIDWPANADAESTLSITVDRTGLADLEPALRSLIEYPYGCLEQTLSRFIPLTKVADLAASLGLDELKGPQLKTFLDVGAAKVVRHQHSDGNFSLWPGGTTYPHLTVYALFGLKQARDAGVKIDEGAYKRGISAVKRHVSRTLTSDMQYGTAAMSAMLLAESGQSDAGLIARLYAQRKSLPLYGRGFLLMAMHHGGSDKDLRRNLVGELARALEDGIAREKKKHTEVMGSDVRSSAIIVSALLLDDPQNAVIEEMVAALKKAQRPSGRWATTQENVYGLTALADFARLRKSGTSSVSITLAGQTLASERLRGSKVLTISRAMASAKGSLKIEARGPVAYSVRRRAALPVDGTKTKSNGFTIRREFLDPKTGKPVTKPKVGQILVARIAVSTKVARRWVALASPLPAGIEPLNTKLATTRQDRASAAEKQQRWYNRWDHIELRDTETRAFRDYLPQGETTLTYRVKVTMPGVFTALPAHVEEMYEPEIAARTSAETIEITR